jgi:hypothetical protein
MEFLGFRRLYKAKHVLIEFDDFESVEVGEEVTLLNWGNVIIKEKRTSIGEDNGKIYSGAIIAELNLAGDFKKTKKKIHWLPAFLPPNAASVSPALLASSSAAKRSPSKSPRNSKSPSKTTHATGALSPKTTESANAPFLTCCILREYDFLITKKKARASR